VSARVIDLDKVIVLLAPIDTFLYHTLIKVQRFHDSGIDSQR